MKTELLKVNEESVALGARLIREGELVGFPTETVYGLGANALDARAVAKIFEAKGRPQDNPLITHVACVEEIPPLVRAIPAAARKLMEAFWPGPMTLILPKADCIPDAVSAGLDTVGIRLPANADARRLIRASGCPIAAPSANRSGRPSPTTALHVLEDMDGRIPLILDGGACQVGVESSVIDATGEVPVILRPGGITPEMVERVLGHVRVDEHVMSPLREGDVARSPGMKYKHYAPKAKAVIFSGAPEHVVSAICRRYDEQTAKAAIDMTASMDQMERDIENRCLQLLLRQQPVARDLRAISAAMKMVTDLQRIGDQAANIAEISLLFSRQGEVKVPQDIGVMACKAGLMVRQAISSYTGRDVETAHAVVNLDDEVDELFRKIKGDLINQVADNLDEADLSIDFIIIAKYLERIADHAVNIAQWAIFCVTGEL